MHIIAYPTVIYALKSLLALFLLHELTSELLASDFVLYGIYLYFSQILNGLVVCGISNLTLYNIANNEYEARRDHVAKSLYLLLFLGLLSLSFSYFLSDFISSLLFRSKFKYLPVLAAILSVCYGFSIIINSYITGLGQAGLAYRMSLINTVSTTTSVVVGLYSFGLAGAMVGFSLASVLYCFINFLQVPSDIRNIFLVRPRRPSFDWLKKYKSYAIIGLFSLSVMPIYNLCLRLYIADFLGDDLAGYQEVMTRLSVLYTGIAASILSVYFMPKFSTVNTEKEFSKVILQSILLMLFCFTIGGFLLYSFRNFFTELVLGEGYKFVENIIGYYIIADTLRAIGWCVSYYLLSKGSWVIYISSEVVSLLAFILFYYLFIDEKPEFAIGLPYLLGSFLFSFIMILVAFKTYKSLAAKC